jgi:hypothetical protein
MRVGGRATLTMDSVLPRVNLPEKMVNEVMPVMEGLSVKHSDIWLYNSAVWCAWCRG